jgi:hypothetical protein
LAAAGTFAVAKGRGNQSKKNIENRVSKADCTFLAREGRPSHNQPAILNFHNSRGTHQEDHSHFRGAPPGGGAAGRYLPVLVRRRDSEFSYCGSCRLTNLPNPGTPCPRVRSCTQRASATPPPFPYFPPRTHPIHHPVEFNHGVLIKPCLRNSALHFHPTTMTSSTTDCIGSPPPHTSTSVPPCRPCLSPLIS